MITGYGLMVMMGFLVAGWVMQQDLRQRGLNDAFAADIVVAAVLGGIVGAKIYYALLYQDVGLLFTRGGMVWYGGFLGGVAAVIYIGRRKRVPLRFSMDLTAPALAVGYAVGRVGCFLIQDDYGVPSSLPWAMRFPEGWPASTAQHFASLGIALPDGTQPADVLAVHPTQLYEVAAMLLVFWVLWRLRRHGRATGWLFGTYLVMAGVERFAVEFIRAKDDRFIGTLTLAQMGSIALIGLGAYLLARWWRDDGFALSPLPAVLRAERSAGQAEKR